METLITFFSRYGSTKKSAEYLSEKIKGSIVIDLRQNEPNINSFKNIIIGGAIYNGKLCGQVKQFLKINQNALKDKKLFIYINCVTAQSFNEVVKRDIPPQLVDCAEKIVFASGTLPNRISLADKFRFACVKSKIRGLPEFKIDYTALDEIATEI